MSESETVDVTCPRCKAYCVAASKKSHRVSTGALFVASYVCKVCGHVFRTICTENSEDILEARTRVRTRAVSENVVPTVKVECLDGITVPTVDVNVNEFCHWCDDCPSYRTKECDQCSITLARPSNYEGSVSTESVMKADKRRPRVVQEKSAEGAEEEVEELSLADCAYRIAVLENCYLAVKAALESIGKIFEHSTDRKDTDRGLV